MCEKKFLEGILKLAGRAGEPIEMQRIRWKPFNLVVD